MADLPTKAFAVPEGNRTADLSAGQQEQQRLNRQDKTRGCNRSAMKTGVAAFQTSREHWNRTSIYDSPLIASA